MQDRDEDVLSYHSNKGRDVCALCGNFRLPWVQHRKMIPGEAVFGSA